MARPMSYAEEVLKCLTVCAKLLKGTALADVDGAVVKAWCALLRNRGVPQEDLGPVFGRLLESETFFPTPAKWFECWHGYLAEVRPYWIIRDPVVTGRHGGTEIIGSRAKCEALGVPYEEPEPEAPRELPSPESRREARDRLGAALERGSPLPVGRPTVKATIAAVAWPEGEGGARERLDAQLRDLKAEAVARGAT